MIHTISQASMKMGDGMNPGYLTFLLISVTLILLGSGWKDILLPGISRTSILLFFVMWILSGWFQLQAGGMRIQLTVPLLFGMAVWAAVALDSHPSRIHAWTSGIVMGACHVLLRELGEEGFLTGRLELEVYSAWALAFVAAAAKRSPLWQFAAISVCLSLSELAFVWLNRGTPAGRLAGGAAFSDQWWQTFCYARGLTASAEGARRVYRLAAGWRIKR